MTVVVLFNKYTYAQKKEINLGAKWFNNTLPDESTKS